MTKEQRRERLDKAMVVIDKYLAGEITQAEYDEQIAELMWA